MRLGIIVFGVAFLGLYTHRYSFWQELASSSTSGGKLVIPLLGLGLIVAFFVNKNRDDWL